MTIGKFYFDKIYVGIVSNGEPTIKGRNFLKDDVAIQIATNYLTRTGTWRSLTEWDEVKIGRSLEPVIPTVAAIGLFVGCFIVAVSPGPVDRYLRILEVDRDELLLILLCTAAILAIPNGIATTINERVEGSERFKAGAFLALTFFMIFIGLIKIVAC